MAADVGAALILTVFIPVVNIFSTCFKMKFVILSIQCTHLFCMNVLKYSDYFLINYKLIF
jgi:hypothetical protein